MNQIEIWNNNRNIMPLIVSIPHSGTYIPQTIHDKLVDNIVLANIDWYLPKLYSFLKNLGITTIINNVSRYVIDPNREISDCHDISYIYTPVYTKTTFGNHMYNKDLEDKEISNRITKYYTPYHQALENFDFKVSLNNPYSGGYITRKYANNKVETLQLELSYKSYIDNRVFVNEEFPQIDKTLFIETQEKLKCFFKEILDFLSKNKFYK